MYLIADTLAGREGERKREGIIIIIGHGALGCTPVTIGVRVRY